jgi:hypothetical protein
VVEKGYILVSAGLAAYFVLEAAADYEELDALGSESLFEDIDGSVNQDSASAVEQVNGGVAVLGPRVDGVVRLLDDDRTADAVGLELVERLIHDSGLAHTGGIAHGAANLFLKLQRIFVAAEEFDEQVRAKRGHFAGTERQAFLVATEPLIKADFIIAVDERPAGIVRNGRGLQNRALRYFSLSSEFCTEPVDE